MRLGGVIATAGSAAGVAALLLATSCTSSPEPAADSVPELALGSPEVFVGEQDAVLAMPRDLAIDDTGRLYVLDQQDSRIVAVDPDGAVTALGREGQGPGEFEQPYFMGVTADGLRVYDRSRQHVQVLDLDGAYRDSYAVGQTGVLIVTRGSFSLDGTMAYTGSRLFGDRGLAGVIGPSGGEPMLVGDFIADREFGADFVANEIHNGQVPTFMRNHVLPLLTPGGELWLFLQSESALQRYSGDGELLRSASFIVPEADAIRAEYFDWYRAYDDSDGVMRYFEYATDGFATDERVWLLWATPAGQAGLITVHDETGAMLRRLVYEMPAVPPTTPDPEVPYVSRRFLALDAERQRLYLADTDTSSVFVLAVPGEALR